MDLMNLPRLVVNIHFIISCLIHFVKGEDACKWKIKCRDGRCYDETKLTKYCKDDFLTHKIPCCDEFNLDGKINDQKKEVKYIS